MNFRMKGFTLIELMIVVVIIAVIAAIALPTYQNQSLRTKRSDAMIALTQAAAMQERLLTKTGSYTTSEASVLPTGNKTENGAYNFYSILSTDAEDDRKVTFQPGSGAAITKTLTCSGKRCFVLAVAATGTQVNDTECAIITLDSVGRQLSYNSSGVLNDAGTCWK